MKKRWIQVIIAVIFIFGLLIYFQPLKLADLANENQHIIIMHEVVHVENGIPSIASTNYNEITEKEKNEILGVFKEYSYRRKIGTFFSDGSLFRFGDGAVYIYVYDKDGENFRLKNTIYVADSKDIVVNGKTYVMNGASGFMDEILEIIQESIKDD